MSDVDKRVMPSKLLWVDLEMTGLRPGVDVIQEVCLVVTDFSFKELVRYRAVIRHPRELVERLMAENPWFLTHESNRTAFLEATDFGQQSYLVEQELVQIVDEHFDGEPAVLAGNSIHNDRKFIAHAWPELDSRLHYRMLDVSSWKVWMQGAYGVEYTKKEAHRAEDDIQESMDELRYYLDWFKRKKTEI